MRQECQRLRWTPAERDKLNHVVWPIGKLTIQLRAGLPDTGIIDRNNMEIESQCFVVKVDNGKRRAHKTTMKENRIAVFHLTYFGVGELAAIGQSEDLAHEEFVVETRFECFDVHFAALVCNIEGSALIC